VKRIKALEFVCIDMADPKRCDLHVTWQDNTFEVFFDGDRINLKRVMRQFEKQAKENSKLDGI
jgi:hypothetical protein